MILAMLVPVIVMMITGVYEVLNLVTVYKADKTYGAYDTDDGSNGEGRRKQCLCL